MAFTAQEDPINLEALIDLGKFHFHQGRRFEAQKQFAQVCMYVPQHWDYKALFLESVAGGAVEHFDETIKEAIRLCLAEPELMHLPLFFAWHSLLRMDPDLPDFAALESCGSFEDFASIACTMDLPATLNDPFLCLGLQRLLIKDYGFEWFLTHTRRFLLMHADENLRTACRAFMSALAHLCFFNEYIFYVTPEEEKALGEGAGDILLRACYRKLSETDAQNLGDIQEAVPLIALQVTQPQKEEVLKSTLGGFGSIQNTVSQAVQQQYEENPFPRWQAATHTRRDAKLTVLSAGKKVLVAGCGTGQQAAIVARNFPYAAITAIDLSRVSLAYAVRKTQELGIDNIEFRHGDILEVAALGQQFDYIACGGVLHHMASPQDGLAALKNVLAPAGVMRIALYSEIARRSIARVQHWIAQQKIPSTLEAMRQFRKDFVERDYRNIFGHTLPFFDCFSASDCRDIFFHEQEHRFNCIMIEEMLRALELDLLIFAAEMPQAKVRYRQLFPEDPAALNLRNWNHLELKNPNSFMRMYRFYIAHPGDYAPGELPEWLQ